MSLDTVVEDIRDEARARAEDIREEGERRAEEITERAEADAEEIVADREEAVEDEIAREREQALSGAKLEAKQRRLEARRGVLEDVHEDVEAHLADLDGDGRRELTTALVEAAAAEFDDEESVAVYGRADDETLLSDVLADHDGMSYAGETDCLGGVVAEGDSSRVRIDNTFDSVFESVWEDNLKAISDRLFDDEQ